MKTISDYDLSNMRFNIMDDVNIVKRFEEKIPSLIKLPSSTDSGIIKSYFLKYMALVYDIGSPLYEKFPDTWKRKYEAAYLAGFTMKPNGTFEKDVEEMILGKKSEYVDAVIDFCCLMGNSKWANCIFYGQARANLLKKAESGDELKPAEISFMKELSELIDKNTHEFLRCSDETNSFLERFYYRIEKQRILMRPEDMATAIQEGEDFSDYSPYNSKKKYKVGKIKLV